MKQYLLFWWSGASEISPDDLTVDAMIRLPFGFSGYTLDGDYMVCNQFPHGVATDTGFPLQFECRGCWFTGALKSLQPIAHELTVGTWIASGTVHVLGVKAAVKKIYILQYSRVLPVHVHDRELRWRVKCHMRELLTSSFLGNIGWFDLRDLQHHHSIRRPINSLSCLGSTKQWQRVCCYSS